MPKYDYVALDNRGKETKGTVEVASQNEAIGRVKEMGLFPTKIIEAEKVQKRKASGKKARSAPRAGGKKGGGMNINLNLSIPGLGGKVKPKVLTTFTRQLATLVDSGLPLLRGLRVLEKQERNGALKRILGELALAIEGGSTFSEALAQHPKVFNRLFVNMIKAGELGGVLEVVLKRLAEFSEKAAEDQGQGQGRAVLSRRGAHRGRGHPDAVDGHGGAQVQGSVRGHGRQDAGIHPVCARLSAMPSGSTSCKRWAWRPWWWWRSCWPSGPRSAASSGTRSNSRCRSSGPVISKVAIARFTRTLGTLVSSGVPILQALTIVKETAGNVIISNAISGVHESVKEGETITAPLEASGVFPPMVVSMVDVGEQTGALPEMLLKISDNYDEEVDNAVASMTSLLEPIMIVFLAVVVGSIVIAMFLPLIAMITNLSGGGGGGGE